MSRSPRYLRQTLAHIDLLLTFEVQIIDRRTPVVEDQALDLGGGFRGTFGRSRR